MTTLTAANRQWASRADEERFTSLQALHDHMVDVRAMSKAFTAPLKALSAMPATNDDGSTGLVMVSAKGNPAHMSNWAFSQLTNVLGTESGYSCPTGYLASLPPAIAADCINHGLSRMADSDQRQFLMTANDGNLGIRAINSPTYGRVWNEQITGLMLDRFPVGGDWSVPGEFGKAVKVTKANTTIFGSDRDMFVFLADEKNRIELPNRRNGESGSLARGFFISNSEVGAATLSVSTFLFDYVCSNRLVWGATEVKEIKIRHSLNAPGRFLDEILPALTAYQNAPASNVESVLKLAQETKVGDESDFDRLMKRLDINPKTYRLIDKAHTMEELRPMESMWDVSTGITAFAKTIPYQSDRVVMERKAGLVLDMVAA
jgi:hypothetical protein